MVDMGVARPVLLCLSEDRDSVDVSMCSSALRFALRRGCDCGRYRADGQACGAKLLLPPPLLLRLLFALRCCCCCCCCCCGKEKDSCVLLNMVEAKEGPESVGAAMRPCMAQCFIGC